MVQFSSLIVENVFKKEDIFSVNYTVKSFIFVGVNFHWVMKYCNFVGTDTCYFSTYNRLLFHHIS